MPPPSWMGPGGPGPGPGMGGPWGGGPPGGPGGWGPGGGGGPPPANTQVPPPSQQVIQSAPSVDNKEVSSEGQAEWMDNVVIMSVVEVLSHNSALITASFRQLIRWSVLPQ